jgi:hypothetical protein
MTGEVISGFLYLLGKTSILERRNAWNVCSRTRGVREKKAVTYLPEFIQVIHEI